MSFKILNETEIAERSSLIATPFPLMNAVVDGKQAGKIFAMRNNFFVLHQSGFGWFKPEVGFDDYETLLNFLIDSKELPVYFHVYDSPLSLTTLCIENKATLNVKCRNRIQLKRSGQHLDYLPDISPEGFCLKRIAEDNLASLEPLNLQIGNKFWKSPEDFFVNGFGFAAFTYLDEPVSVCYTACIAQNIAEIDVATVPPFQQKGLAKLAVSAFVQYCNEKKIIASWDCFEDNIGSLKTATSLGFERVLKYEFLSIYNKQKAL